MIRWLISSMLLVSLLVVPTAFSATFEVTVVEDSADGVCDAHCSLREAVIAANQSSGTDVINLPEGVFALTLIGADEDGGLTGDLDISESVNIYGMGWNRTVVDGLGSDRVFDFHFGADSIQIADLMIRDGSSIEGGAIRSRTSPTSLHLAHLACVGNWSQVLGGAVLSSGPLIVADCLFAANSTGSHGGAIMARGPVEVVRTVFDANRCGYGGGGISTGIDDTVTISDSVLTANLASYGGGVNIDRNDVTLVNTTFTVNSTFASRGGAVSTNRGTVTFRNCTLADDAGDGNGAEVYTTGDTEITFENTILSGPDRFSLCSNPLTSAGFNLSTDESCGFEATGDITGVEPALHALRDNGGPTWTRALATGSPAIDAGGGTFVSTDQRGVARPVGPAPDIGAYEAEGDEKPIGLPLTVPVVAHVEGVGGTPWRSDVAITNPDDSPIEITIEYLPMNGNPAELPVELAGGATVLYEDIVASAFGAGDGQGTLVVTAPAEGPTPVVASRTYAQMGDEGLGQGMPGLDPFAEGTYFIPGLREDSEYRSNIGVAAGDHDLTVQINLFRGLDGAVGTTFAQTIPAGSQRQWRLPVMFPGMAQAGVPMSAEVRLFGPGVPYGSLVDQVSADAVTLVAVPASSARLVPVVAHNPGMQGTFWRSDLSLHNPNPVEAKVYAEYFSEGSDNSEGGQKGKQISIPAFSTMTVADAARRLFNIEDGKGVMTVAAAPGVAVASRTYTTRTDGGTYGLGVPALPMATRTPRPLLLTGIRVGGGFRTNIGIIGGERAEDSWVRLFGQDGTILESVYIRVEARSLFQDSVRDVFPDVDWGDFSVGSVVVGASGQVRAAYSSTVDGSSQDPIFAMATPVE